MPHFKFFVVVLAAIFSTPAAAFDSLPSQGLPPEASLPAVQAAWIGCQNDIQRFCPDVPPGGGRIVRCLVANHHELTPVCLNGMLNARAALGR